MKQEAQFQNIYKSQEQLNPTTNSQPEDLFSGIQLQCPFQQPAHEYCCEQNCKQNAVTCHDEDCKCQIPHQNCDNFLRVRKFHKKINKKIINYQTDDFEAIEKGVDSVINKASEMLEEISMSLKTFGLNKNEQAMRNSILSYFNKNSSKQGNEKLTGETLFKFRAEQKEAEKKWLKYSLQKYKGIIQKAKNGIEPLFQEIQNSITEIHAKKNDKSLNAYFSNSFITKQSNQTIFSGMVQNLSEMLTQRMKVSSIKKLYTYQKPFSTTVVSNQQQPTSLFAYTQHQANLGLMGVSNKKAPQNKQSILGNQILSALKGKSNLLFIVQNIHGKIFGAYLSCPFSEQNEWLKDPNGQTFVFSLSNDTDQNISYKNQGFRFNSKTLQIGGGKYQTMHEKNNGFTLLFGDQIILTEIVLSQMYSQNTQPQQNPIFKEQLKIKNKKYEEANGRYGIQGGYMVSFLEVYEVKGTYLNQREKFSVTEQLVYLMNVKREQNKNSNILARSKDYQSYSIFRPRTLFTG